MHDAVPTRKLGSLGTKVELHPQEIAGAHFVDYIDCIRRTPHRYWQHPTITKEIRKLGAELLKALDEGKVKYIMVRAPIGAEAGEAVLRDVKVTEFLVPPG